MDRLESFGLVRGIDRENGRVTIVISTDSIARDGWIIEAAGWRFDNYDRNPVVLWAHNDLGQPFARTVEHLTTDSELIATAEFDMEDPDGVSIFRKISQGFINAASVRWLPIKYEWRKVGDNPSEILVFTEQELLEWSFVPVPSDAKALVIRADGRAFNRAEFAPEPPPAPPEDEEDDEPESDEPSTEDQPSEEEAALADLEERAVAAAARFLSRPRIDDLIVRGLSKATGKTEERVRREMAGGRV